MRVPLRMVFVDTEAQNEQGKQASGRQRLTFGVARYVEFADSDATTPARRATYRFRSSGAFWDWCLGFTLPGRVVWIFAHNWNYDAGILNTSVELPARKWELDKYINGNPPLIVRWSNGKSRLQMVDTLNYFSSSLDRLGKDTGLHKLRMPSAEASQQQWDTYAERDVEIIERAFLSFREFVRDHDLGVLQTTVASQAFTAYRHRFMGTNILVHNEGQALSLERQSYHGGRTETFWTGPINIDLYKLDINSMYPSLMGVKPLSVRFKAYFTKFLSSWWHRVEDGFGVVAQCKIETDQPVYGVVYNDRLIFPVGSFTTVLTTPEVHFAIKHGHLKAVGQWAIYEQEVLFKDYVDYFQGLRAEYKAAGNQTFDYLSKTMGNALYGKFGQNGRKWVETSKYELAEPSDEWFLDTDTGELVHLRDRIGQTQMLLTDSESENSCPIIASEITAHGRIMLWELITLAGVENVYYVDTDSLVVNETGYKNLASKIHPTTPGMLKVEWSGSDAEFWTAKDYRVGSDWKIKGIRSNAEKVSKLVYRQDEFRSWDYNLSKRQDGYIDVVSITKHLSRKNTKGVVNGLGRVYPIRLPVEET